jgi:hypothetical protein
MPPAVFRGKRPGPGRRASAITALVALAAATAAGQAVAATSLRVTVTAKPKAASNVSTATFRWKAQGKVRATLCALDRGRFAKCRSGKRYTKLKDGKHRFRVEVKGSGRTKKIATVSWLVDTTAPSVPVAAGGSLAWQAVPSIAISASGATDLGSGLAGYDYRTSTDGGATWSMPSPGSLDSPSFDGETLVQFAAVDKAGNMSAWAPAPDTAEATARIDNLAPFVPTVSGGDLQWQNAAAVVISASDGADVGGAGFDHYEYRTSTDGVNWSAPAAGSSVPISADNETFVQFRSVDAVGNASSWAPTTPDAGSTVRIDRTIPTNPVVSGGTAGWQNVASALVTAGGSTDAQGAGVAFYQYRTSTDGGQTWSAPALGTSLLVSAEGQTLVEFQSVDNANLDSAWIQTAVEIDRTNPSAPTVSGGSPAWQSVPSIDISASNATDSGGSGVAGYEYRISTDGGATWSPTPIAGWDELVTAPGETLVQFRTVDGAGNTSGWVGATARIDTTAPGDPTASGGSSSWQNAASVDVTGSATGDAGGSGVAGLEYRTSTDNAQTWSAPASGAVATVSAEGTTLVQFRVSDGAGNHSNWAPAAGLATATVKLDHTLPTLSGVSGGSLVWKNQASTTITAGTHADAGGSGFSHDEYRTSIDGGLTWLPAAAGTRVAVTAEGETLVQFRAVDNAGNTSAWLPATPTAASTVRLDRTDPTSPLVSGGSSSWQNVPSILLTASNSTDAGAGVTGYEYETSTDGGHSWSAATAGSSLSVTAQGATDVRFRAVDGAGRLSGWTAASAMIDRTKPVAPTVTGGSATWKTSASVTVKATNGSDTGGSLFAGYEYQTSTDAGATWSSPAPGSSLVVSSEGETLVQFQSLDNAGNASAWVQATVRLDRSAPTAPNVSGGSLSWSNAPVTITGAGSTDTGGSGFFYQYRTSTDGINWGQPVVGSSYQVSADGTTYVQFQAVDNAGNQSAWAPGLNSALNTAKVDTTAPSAPAVTGGSTSWQTALLVTVSASSSDSLSGVAGYQYRTSTDGGLTWSSAAAGSSVPVNAQGTTYVQFRATDTAGNQTAWAPAAPTAGSTVKLDRTAPGAPAISGGSLNWSTTAVTLTVSGASDPLSGLQGVWVRTSVNGGGWSTPVLLSGTTYQVSTQGTTVVQAQAIDNAGNASAWSPLTSGAANTVKFDNVAPTIPSATGGQGTACKKHITISVVASTDGTSGIARYDYRVSTNGGSTYGTPVTNQSSVSFSNTGTYEVQFRAVDNAGNMSAWGPATPTTVSTACIR